MRITILGAFFISIFAATAWAQDNQLTPEEVEQGWALLFDGTEGSLDNWTLWGRDDLNNDRSITGGNWLVQNNLMTVNRSGKDIRTDKKYSDFAVSLDYRTNGNQGFMYRATLCGAQIWWSAIEVTIDQNSTDLDWTNTPGAAYSLFEPTENNFVQGQFNKLTVIAIQDSVEHWHNGTQVLGYKYWSDEFSDNYNLFWRDRGSDSPCFAREYEPGSGPVDDTYVSSGYIGVQGDHGGYLEIKNFKILEDPIIGCMDSTRENYNEDANYDYGNPDEYCGNEIINVESTRSLSADFHIEVNHGTINLQTGNFVPVTDLGLVDVQGKWIDVSATKAGGVYSFKGLCSGIYFIKGKVNGLSLNKKVLVF